MSIIDTFDDVTEEIIKPGDSIPEVIGFPDVVVVTFSRKIMDVLLTTYEAKQIDELNCGFASIPIYKICYKKKELAVYTTMMGGPASAALLEQVIAKGGKKFVFFGSCGTLNKAISSGHLIVPSSAYRDDGVSYHYAKLSDYIYIKTADKLAGILSEMEIPYIKTKTWTTDAFYRETRGNMLKRKNDGCLAVEMECASIAAVCQYREVDFYQYLFTEDNLDSEKWERRIMGKLTQNDREKYLAIALEIAIRI